MVTHMDFRFDPSPEQMDRYRKRIPPARYSAADEEELLRFIIRTMALSFDAARGIHPVQIALKNEFQDSSQSNLRRANVELQQNREFDTPEMDRNP